MTFPFSVTSFFSVSAVFDFFWVTLFYSLSTIDNCITANKHVQLTQLTNSKTRLSKCGKVRLKFGNSHAYGMVVVTLNGKQVGRANPNQSRTIEFAFKDGDILELTEMGDGLYSDGVIALDGLNIISCSTCWITTKICFRIEFLMTFLPKILYYLKYNKLEMNFKPNKHEL